MTTEIFPASIIFNYAAYQHRFMTQHVNGIHLSAGNPAIDIFCAQSNIRWHSKYLRPSFSQILGIQNWLAPWSQPESLHQNGRKMLKSQTMQHRNLVKWYQLSFTLARFSTSGEFEVTITTISNIHTANTCRNWELKDLLDQRGSAPRSLVSKFLGLAADTLPSLSVRNAGGIWRQSLFFFMGSVGFPRRRFGLFSWVSGLQVCNAGSYFFSSLWVP